MPNRFSTSLSFVHLAAAGLAAQGPAPTVALPRVELAASAAAFGADVFRAPIHTQARDEALGAYGTWASGDAYKASFHDGFVFFPVLGETYPHNLPWRWRTTSVAVGELALANGAAEPRHAHTEWRYEYDHGAVVEAYDVLPHGVEQTFVVPRRPAVTGDLVVTGRVETELHAAAVAAAHQAIVFHGPAGEAIVRYSEAFAFDAAGRRCAITTTFDGTNVELRVRADWLATATFPVTVDPLTASMVLATTPGIENPAVHRHDEGTPRDTMVVLSRAVSSGDRDVHALLCSPGFQVASAAFTDVSATWSSLLPDVTFVAGADRWVVGFWRHTAAEDRVRAYFHDRDSTSPNSGVVASNHNPGTEHATFLAVGGRSHPTAGTTGLMVYRSDPFFGNSNTTEVHGVALDAVNRTFGGRTLLSSGLADAESPDVNCQIGWGDDGWMVVFQARTSTNDDFDLHMARVSAQTFGATPAVAVGPDGLGDKVRPVVQGWDGRYLIATLQDATPEINGQHFARNVLTVRVDWPTLAGGVNVHPHRTVATAPGQTLTHLALGFDGVSRSHWCLAFDDLSTSTPGIAVRRLGYQGATVESAHLGADSYHGSVAWNGVAREFQLVYPSTNGLSPLYGRLWSYPQAAWHLEYGGSCGPGSITSDTTPLPGSEFYRVLLQNAPTGVPGALCFSGAAGGADLGAIGAPNCMANLASVDAFLPIVTDGNGAASFTMALPNVPLFLGDLYWQFLYLWPAAPTPLPLGVTRGLRASVRS